MECKNELKKIKFKLNEVNKKGMKIEKKFFFKYIRRVKIYIQGICTGEKNIFF